MTLKLNGFWASCLWVGLVGSLAAQTPATGRNQQPQPTFRVQIDAVSMDVIVKDGEGRFVPDLKKDEFEIYEDGVKQEITSMTMSHGGRVTNVLEAAPPPPPEGIMLPPVRRLVDTTGRIFLFFLDDLHLQFQSTGRVRDLLKRMQRSLVHEGDLFGIVSSGPSSISIDMTYDRKRFDDAINRVTGSGMKPTDIIQKDVGLGGPSELRYTAHVAFNTMMEALENLEKVHNRRKALVWISEGYDFNPFQDSRFGLLGPRTGYIQNQANVPSETTDTSNQEEVVGDVPQPVSTVNHPMMRSETFSDADLAFELAQITRAANRANTTIYTIDPRGLTVNGGDVEEQVDPIQWAAYVRKSQDSMRVLADETGGIAVVNQNNFDRALQQIDASSSDYYVLGYYSSNPDPTRRRRKVEVKVVRNDITVYSRSEYVLKPPPPAAPPPVTKP